MTRRPDVIILGGGPGGMSAALWCADLGLRPLMIDRNAKLGGQLLWTHNPITNYLGERCSNGSELARKFEAHISSAKIEVVQNAEVTSVDLAAREMSTAGESFQADAIVIATGVRRRRLGIPGEDEFVGHGILTSGAKERENVRGQRVTIVGGGDAALENALILSEYAEHVTVVHRREEFTARDEFLSAAMSRPNVELMTESRLEKINGGGRIQSVVIGSRDGVRVEKECDAVLIRIGVQPNGELFYGQLETDRDGYIRVDRSSATSMSRVWAVGDVTRPEGMTIANAVGQGAAAAASAFRRVSRN